MEKGQCNSSTQKADKQRKENYRPISPLSCLGKVMERIIYNELYEYCEGNDFLTYKNSGFKKKDSTTNRLLDLTHKLYSSLEGGSDVLLVFLDITKAFDKVYDMACYLNLSNLVSLGTC